MSGSSMHWRDVYSEDAWDRIIELTRTRALTTGQNALFQRASIRMALHKYHAIPKREPFRLEQRRAALWEVKEQASAYLNQRGTAQIAKVSRQPNQPPHKATTSGPPRNRLDPNLDVWVHSLARTAEKKRAYLLHLKGHNWGTGPFSSVASFQLFVRTRSAKVVPPDLLALTHATKLERLDPLHRNFEHDTNPNGTLGTPHTAISRALDEWLSSSTQLSFFLWLEGHEVCTGTKYIERDYQEARSVRYGPNAEIKQVWISNRQLVARSVLDTTNAPVALTTRKQGSKSGGEAFAWLRDGSLLIHPHLSGAFHHSSLNSGQKVRCSGMLKAKNGILKLIDNNSGHYKPTDRHYLTLIGLLQAGGVCNNDTRFGTFNYRDRTTLAMADLTYADYQARATNDGHAVFPTTPAIVAKLTYP